MDDLIKCSSSKFVLSKAFEVRFKITIHLYLLVSGFVLSALWFITLERVFEIPMKSIKLGTPLAHVPVLLGLIIAFYLYRGYKTWLSDEKASMCYSVTFFNDRVQLERNVGEITLSKQNISLIEICPHRLIYPYYNIRFCLNNGSQIKAKYLIPQS